jgi:hypothetical protein
MSPEEQSALLDICKASVDDALSAFAAPSTSLASADVGGGNTYSPGTYTWDAAMVQTGTVYLSVPAGTDAKDATWVFYVGAAFATAADSKIIFVDASGAVLYDPSTGLDHTYANGVHWKITGAVSLGANSHMIGNMEADGAIAVGAGATCDDLEAGGAITLGAGAECRDLEAGGAVTLGATAKGTGIIYAAGAFTKGAGAKGSIATPPILVSKEILRDLAKCKDAVKRAETVLMDFLKPMPAPPAPPS